MEDESWCRRESVARQPHHGQLRSRRSGGATAAHRDLVEELVDSVNRVHAKQTRYKKLIILWIVLGWLKISKNRLPEIVVAYV